VENHQQTYWQVWTLLSPVPRLSKLHRLATHEERGSQDQRSRVHSISEPYRPEELAAALSRVKPGKSPGLDSIFPEFMHHDRSALKSWFCDFLTSCMRQFKIPKIWRRAQIVAIPKPEKPLGGPKELLPISLLCVPFKILERRIYAGVDPIIDPLLLREQAGFLHGRSAVVEVTLLAGCRGWLFG